MKIVNPLTGNVLCGASTYTEAHDYAKEHANRLGTSVEIHPEASSPVVSGMSPETEITIVEPDTSEIYIDMRLREPNFGNPQPDEVTHLKVTLVPTSGNAPVYVPVIRRECGAHWSLQPEGQSGYWWRFIAERPAEMEGREIVVESATTAIDPDTGRAVIL